jgi:multimeric flavodoxin WrbA
MCISKSFLSLSVLLFGVSRAYPQQVTHQEVWSSFTAADRYILGSPTMTYSYGGVSATSQVFAERRAAMQAQRDTPPYAAFQAVQAVIAAVNAAAEERATAFASTQDASEFWQRYNSVTRGWVPQP